MRGGVRGGQRLPVRLALQDARDHVGHRLAREGLAPGEAFVEHAAERPDVGALVDRAAARLLGAHVRRGAENDAGARVLPCVIVGECERFTSELDAGAACRPSRDRSRAP